MMRLKDSPVLEDLDSLSNDLLQLGSEEEGSDLVFVTGREEMVHNCHRSIFRVRCKHFSDVIVNNSEPSSSSGGDSRTFVNLPRFSSASFTTFKQFIYTGRLLVDASVNVMELYRISELFGVKSLMLLLKNSIENNLTLSSVSQFFNKCVECFGEENANSEVTKLLLSFLKEHLTALRDRKLLNGLSKEALIRLIQSNTLDIEENEVWRLCLEWARGQVGLQDTSPAKLWTEEQRSSIRTSLDGVVQCIKILHIDSSVFAEEVEPTGAIPIELSLQRYKHAALPNKNQNKPSANGKFSEGRQEFSGAAAPNNNNSSRVECARALPNPRSEGRSSKRDEPPRTRDDLSRLNPRVESDPRPTLYPPQSQQQQRLIRGSSILSSLGPETSLNYYEQLLNGWVGTPNQAWTVIFRASEHAFSAQAFHRMCDGASPSFVLVKADTGCVGGGYTDIPWSRPNGKGKYVPSDKSFLFSLHNPGRQAAKFEITKKLFAVSHHPDCGPVFGAGADLLICDSCDQLPDSYSNLPHSYDGQDAGAESLMGDYSFIVEEYEVFVPIQN